MTGSLDPARLAIWWAVSADEVGPLRVMRAESGAPHHVHPDDRKGVSPMVVMIGHAGVYLILALVFLAIIGGGVIVVYRMSNRKDE